VLVLLVVLCAFPSTARADIAPPAQPPGSNLQPGTETTQVRMLAETVELDVQPGGSNKSLGLARVTADFTMHNTGAEAETMAARFPIGANDGWFNVNELNDFQVKVAGKRVATRQIMGEDPYFSNSDQVPWAAFDVTFPPGQDVSIQVQYTLQATGEYPFIWFKYILSTGAGWKDSIGSADIVVRLPYEANSQNLLLDTDQVSFGTTKGGTLDGNTIRWHFEDLEPTTQDNFEIHLVTPSAWEGLLTEQQNIAQNPHDGEAWGRLGKLAKAMAFSSRGKGFRAGTMDPGGQQLYDLSVQAYEKAVTLLPRDALWHAGYADLLGYHAYFDAFNGADTTAEALHSMREIQIALDISPNDPKVQQIAEQLSFSFPDGIQRVGDQYVFVWLTTTPEPIIATQVSPTQVAALLAPSDTPVALPSPTTQPQPTPQATASPVSKSAPPVCGSALVLPILLAGLAYSGSRRRVRKP